MNDNSILVTGAAGFIGYHLCRRLAADGHAITGLDNFNSYYDVALKENRLQQIQKDYSHFPISRIDIEDETALFAFFEKYQPVTVYHLAGQAGVRYSLENPRAYVDSNLRGFLNILECCRHYKVRHLVYASSSSVYGLNTRMPFSVRDNVDHPVSLYGATKKANELMAHSYSHLYRIPTTGLRFFTVYGPWGRPDMALFLFTRRMLEGKPIDVFNHGNMQRDFTYIDDIVEGIVRVGNHPAAADPNWSGENPDPSASSAPYRLYNIGNQNPVNLMELIRVLEEELGVKAQLNLLPMQDGDVPATYADVSALEQEVDFSPSTSIREGVRAFVSWFRQYYHI
ncbi:MAG: NAD-dependent epimerase [Leptospiraceae bacterium]|nr:NAD-dependent epimerase [Leptospiraceae bacterium]MCB1314826.1 NAD-dependent epimerase [Leptospiraceae bacterium]